VPRSTSCSATVVVPRSTAAPKEREVRSQGWRSTNRPPSRKAVAVHSPSRRARGTSLKRDKGTSTVPGSQPIPFRRRSRSPSLS